MQPESESLILSRRGWILAAAGALASWDRLAGFARQDFWNEKPLDQWSSDEIHKLLTKSPWAKEVMAQKSSGSKNSSVRRDPTMTNPRMPGTRNSRMPGGMSTPRTTTSAPKTVTTYKGSVVWESAAPVRAAFKTPLPGDFAGMYVISVGGIALAPTRQQEDGGAPRATRSAMDKLRQATALEVKGHDPLEAGVARQITDNGNVFTFGFAKQALEISKDEKEVTFVTFMGKLRFAARFSPKEMIYKGELAL